MYRKHGPFHTKFFLDQIGPDRNSISVYKYKTIKTINMHVVAVFLLVVFVGSLSSRQIDNLGHN